MQAYDWMVKFTPQTEWIERRGILLWLAFFFIELGAGMFFVASLFHNRTSMLAGWLFCAALGGGLHLLFLGKPTRFWRMLFSSGYKTSWISRGLIFVSLFLLLGLVYLLLNLGSDPPAALLVIVNIFAFLTVIYGGFAMNYVNGIPLWNTALLPVLYVISGLWGGAEVTLGISLANGNLEAGAGVENWIRILLIGFVLLVPVYLISIRYASLNGQASVRSITAGQWALLFWLAVVVMGMLIPAVAVIVSFGLGLEQTPSALLYFAILCGLAGDLSLRYLILRCGMYNPLIPSSGSQV
jgi:sulfite dehydrogenase (quinone) subunit SoeC